MRRLLVLMAFPMFAAACGGDSGPALQPVDLSYASADQGPGTDGATASTDDMGSSKACNGVYSKSTIAALRQGATGCYELDGVVSLAVTPVAATTKGVTIYAQDAAGGDYSAVKMGCSSTSTSHPCTVFATAKSVLPGRALTVMGTYIKSAAAKGGFEELYIDSITDTGSGVAPAPAALTEVDLERGATTASTSKPMAAYHFQLVTATISDKLVMYDWTAPELKGSFGTCPQYGFGLIPTSASATSGAACSGTTQPAGQATVNAKEVLVGTDFYGGFTYTTDCACASMYMQPLPTAGQGVTGAITALLNYDVPYMQTVGYQFLSPLTNAAFTIK